MAKLVIGNTKQNAVPAIVKEVPTPEPLTIKYVKNSQGQVSKGTTGIDLDGATSIVAKNVFYNAFMGSQITNINLSSLVTISGGQSCRSMCGNCAQLSNFDLSSLEVITGSYACSEMFMQCTSLTTALLPSLKRIGSETTSGTAFTDAANAALSMFQGCSGLVSADLSNLESIRGGSAAVKMFMGCTSLSSVNISKLKTIYGSDALSQMFNTCPALRAISFTALDNIGTDRYNPFYSTFAYCNNLVISFPALKSTSFNGANNSFNNMLFGSQNCTVHFPSNLESLMSGWSDVTNGFNGTNTTVLFDLPATE